MGKTPPRPPMPRMVDKAIPEEKKPTTIILDDEKNEEKSSPFRPLSDRVDVWA